MLTTKQKADLANDQQFADALDEARNHFIGKTNITLPITFTERMMFIEHLERMGFTIEKYVDHSQPGD